jgi:hypothetical protein
MRSWRPLLYAQVFGLVEPIGYSATSACANSGM